MSYANPPVFLKQEIKCKKNVMFSTVCPNCTVRSFTKDKTIWKTVAAAKPNLTSLLESYRVEIIIILITMRFFFYIN